LQNPGTIAYLAPEIPALSATFVYEEILALERRGYRIAPFSVRKPLHAATNQNELSARVICIYDPSIIGVILSGIISLGRPGLRVSRALHWLVRDISASGWINPSSWKLVFQFLASVKLATMLMQKDCRHLHVHFAHTPAQIGMYASALSGIPFTVTAHANDIFERGFLLRQKAYRALSMLTISEHNRKYLENLGISPHKLAVVRCGVSFQPRSTISDPSSRNRLRIGSLGRMVEKKGFDVLLHAVKVLRDSGTDVTLELAGDGPLHNALVELADNLRVNDACRFIGSIPHNKVAAWIQTLDVFALACKTDKSGDMDGIPVVLMEAMSQSVPVVSSNISGIPELVIDELTGLLAQPDDHIDLARQIRRLADSPELARTLAQNGLRHVIEEFGQEINLDRLVNAFRIEG